MMLSLLLSVIVPPASPAGSPPPHTIVVTKSSPYCTALAKHFNGAFVPMLANDRTLDLVSTQFDQIDTLFSKPDYVTRFLDARKALAKQADMLLRSMPAIAAEIDALRASAALTTDASQAAQMREAAGELQSAYVKQHAMAIDIGNVARTMMDYDIVNAPHPLGGISLSDASLPPEMRDIKHYLRFNGQRDVIAQHEEKAVDTAYAAATTACVK